MISFNALRLRFRLVASDFPGTVCILDGDRSGTVELTRLSQERIRGCDRASAKDFHEIRAVFTRRVA